MPYHSNNTLHLKRVTNLSFLHFLAGGGAPTGVALSFATCVASPLDAAGPWMSPGLPVQELHRRSPLTLLLFRAVLTSPFLVSFCLWYPWLTGVLPGSAQRVWLHVVYLLGSFYQKKWRGAWSVASSEYQLF